MIEQGKSALADAQRYDHNTLRLVVASITALLFLIALVAFVVTQDFAIQADNHALLLELQGRRSATATVLSHLLKDEKTNAANETYFASQAKLLEAQQAAILSGIKQLEGQS